MVPRRTVLLQTLGLWLMWLALRAECARPVPPAVQTSDAVAHRVLRHSRALQQSMTPGAAFQPGPGYSDLYTVTPNTDIDYNSNLLFPGNPFHVEPSSQCLNLGIAVSSADECINFCTLMTDFAVQAPTSGIDQGTEPCLGVSYVSSHPANTSLPPIGCCFPKGSRTLLQQSGKPGVDSYTANARRNANTDMPGADILNPGQEEVLQASVQGKPLLYDPLYGPSTDLPEVLPDKCFGLGTVTTYTLNCLLLCKYWNIEAAATSKCVGVTYVSSQPAADLGCCFLKSSTSTLGVGGSKVGVDSYVLF